jgi:hypothetical protein
MASANPPPRPEARKGKKWEFNTPPGWVVPPAGWEPGPGWRPEESWPEAPAGWQFWKSERDPDQPRRVSTLLKATGTGITLVATVAAAYFGYAALHNDKFSTADWVQRANAECDQQVGSLNQSLFNGLAPQTTGQNGSVGGQSAQVTKVNALLGATNSMSKVVGGLTAIRTPTDGGATQVQAVLTSGAGVVTNLQKLSAAFENFADNMPGTTVSGDLAQEAAAISAFGPSMVSWEKAIGALKLKQCPFYTDHPATPVLPVPSAAPSVQPVASPSPEPDLSPNTGPSPATALNTGEEQLVSSLNPNVLINCTGRPDLETGAVVAAVNCHTVTPGPAKLPLVVRFSSLSSGLSWFEANAAGAVDHDDCPAGQKLGTWSHANIVAGPLGCLFTGGYLRVVWVIDSALIGVIADGSSGSTVYTWWTNSAYLASG